MSIITSNESIVFVLFLIMDDLPDFKIYLQMIVAYMMRKIIHEVWRICQVLFHCLKSCYSSQRVGPMGESLLGIYRLGQNRIKLYGMGDFLCDASVTADGL